MKGTEIMNISGIQCYEKDGIAYLKLENVARGLGFTKKADSGNEVVNWTRVRGYLADLGVVQKCTTGDFIPENIFYRLAMKAKNETAEKFQAKVADEIIPSIRKHGIYATDNVIDQILNNPDFGIFRDEEWKTIDGYENKYMVSNLGRVKSLNYKHTKKICLLSLITGNKGYLYVTLNKNGKHKNFFVHRLVAKAFIPNYNNLPTVNHIDECKTNNRVENLEWASYKENNLYGNHYKKVSESQRNDPRKSKRIVQYDLLGNFIKEWESAKEIQRKLKINNSNVIQNCKGNVKSAGGFVWRYAV